MKNTFIIICLLFIQDVCIAQYTNTHYIAPSPWNYFNRYNELVITTLSTTAVTVTISGSDGTVYSNNNTTIAGTPLRFRFPALNASANASNTVLNGAGLIVSATTPIGVQVRNIASDNYTTAVSGPGDVEFCVQKGNSAFTSLGDQGRGTSFRLGYYANVTGAACYSETGAPLYAVMAVNNSTVVSINGNVLTTLNAGQSYIFQSNLGSLLTASNTVVVNSGMRCDWSSGCGDGVQSQVIPTSNLGNTYVVVRTRGNAGYERSTIIATQVNTTVTVFIPNTNTTQNYTLANAGDFITINNGDGSTAFTNNYITTNNPVAVYTGSADGCEIDMIMQPPLNNCAGSFDVQTNQFLNNAIGGNSVFPYFGYVIIQSDTAKVYFNGQNLESIVGNRVRIGTTSFYMIQYTNAQLGNPANLRFVVNARINVALIESGAGYSMSAFISSIGNAMPPPSVSSNCVPATFTAQPGFSTYKWYNNGSLVNTSTSNTQTFSNSGNYTVTGSTTGCGESFPSTNIALSAKPSVSDISSTSNLGNALNLDGINDYIISPNLASKMPGNDLTIEVWFKANAAGIIVNELGQTTPNVGWHDSQIEILQTGEVRVRVWNLMSISIGTVSFGTWNHAVVRYNASTSVLDGFLNGVASPTSFTGGRSHPVSNGFGYYYAFGVFDDTNLGSGAYFNGIIDEARIWNVARTNAQIQANMYNELVGNETGLVAYYNFNEGTANGTNNTVSNVLDRTSNNYHATFNNIALTGSSSNFVAGLASSILAVGQSLNLTNSTSGGVWNSINTNIASMNSSTGAITGHLSGSTMVYYTITNNVGCSTSVNSIIRVSPNIKP